MHKPCAVRMGRFAKRPYRQTSVSGFRISPEDLVLLWCAESEF